MCWHAMAVKAIVLADQSWVKALKPEDAYDYITEVQLQHDSVQLISWSSMSKDHLALSVGTHASGWPRVIVGSDKAGNLICRNSRCCRMPGIKRKCSHCKHVCEWQKAIDRELGVLEDTGDDPARLNRLSALAAELEGFQLLNLAQSQCPSHTRYTNSCPVSVCKIQPEIAHPVMQARAEGKLGRLTVAGQAGQRLL